MKKPFNMNQLWAALLAFPTPFWDLVASFLGSMFTGTDESLTISPVRKMRAIFFGTFFGLMTVWILTTLISPLDSIQVPLNGYFGVMGFNIASGAHNYSQAYKTDFPKFLKDLLLLKRTITNEKDNNLPADSGNRPA